MGKIYEKTLLIKVSIYHVQIAPLSSVQNGGLPLLVREVRRRNQEPNLINIDIQIDYIKNTWPTHLAI